jgi:hypothetical protein
VRNTALPVSRRVTILGETQDEPNIPSPAQAGPSETSKGKVAKGDSKAKNIDKPTSRTGTIEDTNTDVISPPVQQRIVSAPSPKKPRPSSSTNQLRATSNPTRPRAAPRPSTAVRIPSEPILEEESDGDGVAEVDQTVLNLSWALRTPAAPIQEGWQTQDMDCDAESTIEQMRREIGTLQLDMLRMGRDLRVRHTLCPLPVRC